MSQTEVKEDKPVEIHVDLAELLKKIDEKFAVLEAKISPPKTESKGETLPAQTNPRARIVEALKSGSLREQWEKPISIPKTPIASLLEYVQISTAIQGGKPGDTVNIPYVKDVTASDFSGSPPALQAVTTANLYGTATATLKGKGMYVSIPYGDIEKMTESLLGEIENAFEKGIIRAIDAQIVADVAAASGVSSLDKSGSGVAFDADWIVDAMAATGKDFRPEDWVLVLTPAQYVALYKDIVSSQALTFARPDVVRQGLVSEFCGVKILVLPKANMPNGGTGNAYKCACLIHRSAVVVAPKREMLFETQRVPESLIVKLAASYTFADAVVDPSACCKIITAESASS